MSPLQLVSAGPHLPDASAHNALPHVLFIVDGFPKALGGGERVVLRMAHLLPSYGFRASILTLSHHPESEFQPEHAPCPVYLLPLKKAYDLQALRGALALGRFLRTQRVQIVQTFFESSDLWGGLVTRALSPARLIWSRRDMGILRGPKHTRAYRGLRSLPHAVFAVSHRVAGHVISEDRVPRERVHVIHNGLDLEIPLAQPEARPRVGPVITTIGNVRRVKGHDVLLDAATEVIRHVPEATFTVAGQVLEPEFFEHLQRTVAERGLGDNFIFLGNVSDLKSHLASADIFVLPSRSEGFSNALVEAMVAGLPTIATDVGGNAEAIVDQSNGVIVPPDDAGVLSAAILDLLQNPDRARRLGQAAQATAMTEFTASAMMRKVTDRYRALLRA